MSEEKESEKVPDILVSNTTYVDSAKNPQDRNLTYVRSDKFVGQRDQLMRIPRASWKVRGSHIRSLWKDRIEKGVNLTEIFPDLFTNEDYDLAIVDAIIDFNDSPPPTIKFDPTNFPDEYYLLQQGFSNILKVAIAYHANNYFTGSGGGVQVPVHERFQTLQPIAAQIDAEMDRRKVQLKRRLHILEAFGSTNHYEAWGFYGRNFTT